MEGSLWKGANPLTNDFGENDLKVKKPAPNFFIESRPQKTTEAL